MKIDMQLHASDFVTNSYGESWDSSCEQIMGVIHSTKIPTSSTGKSVPPQKVDQFFRNFSGWTELIH